MKTARGAETRAPGVRLLLHDGEGFIHKGLAADLVVELGPHGARGFGPGGFVGHVVDDHAVIEAFLEGDFVLLGGSDLAEYQNKPGQPRPSFPKIQKANQDSEKPAGEWNEANIFVKNGVITVYINGVYQNTGTNKVKEGYIGLQSEGKEVQFRNVTITPW